MGNKGVLSSAFNMSLGFIPVIVSILLCEFITQDISIYIGTGIGLIYSYRSLSRKGARIPNFILYISTGILTLLTLASFIPGDFVPEGALPLTLEVSILIPMVILFLHRRKFISHYLRQNAQCNRRLFAQGAESAIVSARVVLILGILHFAVISLTVLVAHPLTRTSILVLYHVLPPTIFILSILLNQIGIRYFNHVMAHTEYVPIVNTRGDVIGKSLAVEAINYKNAYINPVIRIAVSTHGMLFLCNRPQSCILDKGKVDIPMECYLRYGETLTAGANRLLSNAFPKASDLKPTFTISYHFENEQTNRLVYLFIVDMEDDSILCDPRFKGGKLMDFPTNRAQLRYSLLQRVFRVGIRAPETGYWYKRKIQGILVRSGTFPCHSFMVLVRIYSPSQVIFAAIHKRVCGRQLCRISSTILLLR